MRIVGMADETCDGDETCDRGEVVTIDVWYSPKRGAWIVERLNAAGDQVGPSWRCPDGADSALCIDEWLRLHPEAYLISSINPTAARRSYRQGRRRAA